MGPLLETLKTHADMERRLYEGQYVDSVDLIG